MAETHDVQVTFESEGAGSNTVHIDASWSNAGTSGGYTHYVNNGVNLFIDTNVHVQVDNP